MKFVFVSNYLNHHQLSFCETLKAASSEFHFIETGPELKSTYQAKTRTSYTVVYGEEKEAAEKYILEADAVLFGNCPNSLINLRMKPNKLSFLYSERFFKKSLLRRFLPKARKTINDRIAKHGKDNMYALCASAYLPLDLSFFGFPDEKCFKWGYFPKTAQHSDIDDVICKKKKNSIVWVGRMIRLKHPDHAIKVAKLLRKDGIDFEMTMVGDGPLRDKIQGLIDKNKLHDFVKMTGSVPVDQVRKSMEESSVFLFTSDKGEGWGAVLNEAMNSACAVVASHSIGSVPYLVENGNNGLIYKSGDINDLYEKTKRLLTDKEYSYNLGKRAYETTISLWNEKTAVKRLFDLTKALLDGNKPEEYPSGPCSRSELLNERWIEE